MEKDKNRYYCVILAGGKGRRLWPSSREACPKQFMDFFGCGKTQLQLTYERFVRFIEKEHILVCTTQMYKHTVHEQLPDLPVENILAEPIHRNTAPSVSWATRRIMQKREDACMIVSPADQLVLDEAAFRECVLRGLEFASENELLLALGISPTRPEPGYGYIQIGEATDMDKVYKVQSFTEKPDREFAKVFMESGEFLWNTGLFVAQASYLRDRFIHIFPEVLRRLREQSPQVTLAEEQQFMADNFTSLPNISMDKGMLELNERAYVMKCDFGWADVGTWHGIYESMHKVENDNVVIDSEVLMEDSTNNIIKLPKGKLGVINGLDGFIVAEKDNVLLICRKSDSSSLLKKYVNEVGMKYGDAFV